MSNLPPTQSNGRMKPSKENMVAYTRLTPQDHQDLSQTAQKEGKSMSYILMRRYLKGKDLETTNFA